MATHSVRADISSIPNPFTGSAIESWENHPVVNPGSPTPIFGGQATISGDNPFIWMTTSELGAPGGLGLGPFPARAFDGMLGYVTSVSPGTAQIRFLSPITDFGGYWAHAVGYPPVSFAFYDPQGTLIGSQNFSYSSPNNDGTLEWQGWHSTVPISSIEYSGHWVANDSLRFAVVPEPSTTCLFVAAVLAVIGWRRLTTRT